MLFETLRAHRPYCVIVAFDCKLWSLLSNLKSDPEILQEMRETIGRKSLKLVVEICIWQHDHGRFFLVENPAGSLAWVWEDLLRRLLSRCLAKFVISDQCAYGKVDLESGKPIRKPTGWLSNDEVLLNHLGKRCTCRWGSHQLVLLFLSVVSDAKLRNWREIQEKSMDSGHFYIQSVHVSRLQFFSECQAGEGLICSPMLVFPSNSCLELTGHVAIAQVWKAL